MPSPPLQLTWDAHSLNKLKTCPRLYQLSIIEGWRHKAPSYHLAFGIAYHKALETYAHSRAQGASHTTATLDAVHAALLCPSWEETDSKKTRETLVRTIVWYLDHYKASPYKTIIMQDGTPAVELHFQFPVDIQTTAGETFQLCGHLDNVVTNGTEELIHDPKTTGMQLNSNYAAQYLLDDQMTIYTIAGQVAFARPVKGVLIDAAQVAVTMSRFSRFPVHRTQAQLDTWLQDLQFWLRIAESCHSADYWPKNEASCNGRFGGCVFRDVCSKHPSVQPNFLHADFKQEPWDPSKPRKEDEALRAKIDATLEAHHEGT